MAEGPITHNGIHPITHTRPTLQPKGHAGSSSSSTPKAAQVAGEGAKPGGGGGQHVQAGKGTSIADKFYPAKRPGLKGKMED